MKPSKFQIRLMLQRRLVASQLRSGRAMLMQQLKGIQVATANLAGDDGL